VLFTPVLTDPIERRTPLLHSEAAASQYISIKTILEGDVRETLQGYEVEAGQ
jgi:hypothetical protein